MPENFAFDDRSRNNFAEHDKNNITFSEVIANPSYQELSLTEVPRSTGASIQSPTNANSSRSWLTKQFAEPCGCSNNLVVKVVGGVVILLVLWALLYTLVKQEVAPSGGLFQMIVLVLLGYIVGQIVEIVKLPPLLGMMLTGIVLRTIGFIDVKGPYVNIIIILRQVALAMILVKGGLGLDAAALARLSLVVLRLGFGPCLAEAMGVATVSHFVLGYPWVWALLLGFTLSAVSPAVVVPTLLDLNEKGYGRSKGISTLVIAASGLDDVIAITLFGVFLSMVSSTGDVTTQILQGPIDLAIGLVCGVAWGIVAGCLPHREDSSVVSKRTIMVGGGGLCAVIGSGLLYVPGAGPLTCITSAFVAGICWKLQGWPSERNPVECIFSLAWIIVEPVLFGLIGAEIDLNIIQWDTIAYGLCVIAGGLLVRIIVCSLVLLGGNLNFKEIILINFAWLTKASVQAALAPEPLDVVRRDTNPAEEDLTRGSQILTIAVLSILITAPIGAIGLTLAGPRFLSKDPPKNSTITEKL